MSLKTAFLSILFSILYVYVNHINDIIGTIWQAPNDKLSSPLDIEVQLDNRQPWFDMECLRVRSSFPLRGIVEVYNFVEI